MPRQKTPEEVAALYTEEVQKRIDVFRAWMAADPSRTERSCSRLLRCSQSTLSKLLSHTYGGNVERYSHEMLRVVARDRARQAAPARPDYVQTGVAEQVHDVLASSLIEGSLVCILGPTGIGKTTAARAFYEAEPAALWLTAGCTCTQHAMLTELCRILELEPRWSAYTMQASIVEKLEGTRQILIVDEADDMQLAALKTLRIIHDATGLAVALIGTSDFIHNLRLKRSATVNQILGRVADCLRLGDLTRDDLEAIVASYELDEDAMDALWSGCHGQARRAVSALIGAQRGRKRGQHERIDARSIRRAYTQLMPVLNGLSRAT